MSVGWVGGGWWGRTVSEADLEGCPDRSSMVSAHCIPPMSASPVVCTPTEHSRFVLNQHTIIGMAEYVPIAARKSAPYCRCRLSCTTRRMTKPASETAVVASTNTYRIRSQSDAVAESIASANAHAHGGTESSCVRIWPYPRLWMIVGAKYAADADEDKREATSVSGGRRVSDCVLETHRNRTPGR